MQSPLFANGKLLLSGEYAVLKGAKALAIPTKYGQSLQFNKNEEETLVWQSLDYQDNIWFEAIFDLNLNLLSDSSDNKATYLQLLLKTAETISSQAIEPLKITTKLDFPNNWGLGSSSTLVYLIATWFKIDPMVLFFKTSTGSGYDVAIAGEKSPIVYTLKEGNASWEKTLLPKVYEEVFFVHLNKKQQSKPEVERFLKTETDQKFIEEISFLTNQMLLANSIKDLQDLMNKHEQLLSKKLSVKTVKAHLFSDFEGSVKSLGAWGGDFVMVLGEDVENYFSSKSFNTVIPFRDIIA